MVWLSMNFSMSETIFILASIQILRKNNKQIIYSSVAKDPFRKAAASAKRFTFNDKIFSVKQQCDRKRFLTIY